MGFSIKINENESVAKILKKCVEETTPTEIKEKLKINGNLLSNYLREIKKEGLLSCKHAGRKRFYKLKKEKLAEKWLDINIRSENSFYKIITDMEKKEAGTWREKTLKNIKKRKKIFREIYNNKIFKYFLASFLKNCWGDLSGVSLEEFLEGFFSEGCLHFHIKNKKIKNKNLKELIKKLEELEELTEDFNLKGWSFEETIVDLNKK